MVIILPWCLWISCFLDVFYWGHCYNIDVNHTVILENPDPASNKSYFGYSVVLFGKGKYGDKWIKIGAPKATFTNGAEGPVKHSGVVYHCPIMQKCFIENKLNYSAINLTDAWTGGVMDINYKYEILVISASQQQNDKTLGNPNINGALFIEDLTNQTFTDGFSPLREPASIKVESTNISYYERTLTGFSLHFPQDQNELLVGAPGVSNFMGTVFRVQNIDDKKQHRWKYNVIEPIDHYYQYSGYAVTSGKFYKNNHLYYVSGFPRGYNKTASGNEVLVGLVLIFDFGQKKGRFGEEVINTKKEEIYGTQLGEYFGSSLGSGDLNGDGKDDLIVGAPFRCNDKAGFNQGSVYVFFGKTSSNNNLNSKPQVRIDGTTSGGQLGLAVMVLGDLDGDKLPEMAVSAPHEELSGVVYIYSYNKDTKKLEISQTILGKNILEDLRGFGTSFSRGFDIDANFIKDFAVGAPLSGHAVIFRSKPTVFVRANIKVTSNISTSDTAFSFQCCYLFKDYLNDTLDITRHLTVDEEFGRFYFNDSQQNFEEKTINIKKRDKEFCEDVNLFKRTTQNVKPISIILTAEIPEDVSANKENRIVIGRNGITTNDTFCKECPILSKRLKTNRDTKRVILDPNCNHNGVMEHCQSQLNVTAEFLELEEPNTYILGSEKVFYMQVTITNKGDPAFYPLLKIVLPNGVGMASVDCQNQNSDGYNVTCDGVEVLKANDTVKYILTLDIHLDETDELNFVLRAFTITENINDESTANLGLKLKRKANFFVTGYSKESVYIYEKRTPMLIQNIFKIEKVGPSPTPPVEVRILIPYKIKGPDGVNTKFAKIVNRNDRSVKNPLVACETVVDQKEEYGSKTIQKQSVDDSLKVFQANCTAKKNCAILKCTLGPFQGTQNLAQIFVDLEVDFQQLDEVIGEDWLEGLDQILITTDLDISTNFTETRNNITNVISIYNYQKIPAVIWMGSAVAGLVILIGVTIGLYKAGFFERKQYKMLIYLKEEALEEEKMYEEIMQKDLETDEPLEEDPVLKCLKPEELEIYGRHHGGARYTKLEDLDINGEILEENLLYDFANIEQFQ